MIVHCSGDRELDRAIAAFEAQLDDPPSLLRATTFEAIADAAAADSAHADWVQALRRRYLDLTPVESASS